MSTEIIGSDNEAFREYCAKKMSVQKEFIKLFYDVLFMAAYEGKEITHRQAFNLLNELYFRMSGKLRFKNYESFHFTKIRMDHIVFRNKSTER